ncbi:MAG: DUF58 domain-containing protein [Zetaproteobacteria bacterium CG17_big_fil_post_rev_8_21_14_2_50_50_13]|nr:MAG: DUF58 domain-containing protein [Zetaproteobacteria bacterium CG17_big_fil_post_rev_8_21_14_2_50_50_13]
MLSQALQRPSPTAPDLHYLTLLQRKAKLLHLGEGYPRALQAGAHRSHFQGQGMEFDESRLYQPGDDIRNMDWRVTARTGKAHTKIFREERERPGWLALDLRPPMFFGTRGALKSIIATEVASLLAWSVLHQGDRVGGLIIGAAAGRGSAVIKPAHGRRSIMRLLGLALDQPLWTTAVGQQSVPETAPDLLPHVQHLEHLAHSGSLLVIISDGRGMNEQAVQRMRRLLIHHQVIFVLIHDPFESALHDVGLLALTNGVQKVNLDTANRNILARHQSLFAERRQALESLDQHPNFFLLSCCTTDDPFSVLNTFLGRKP